MTMVKDIAVAEEGAAEALQRRVARVEQKSLLSGGRIPSLDGLRAISIAMVLGEHAINALVRTQQARLHEKAHDYEGPWRVLCNGGLGVSTFFTISGFLITLLLLREFRKTGKVGLLDFYVRRAFRIWPAFYFYIACVVVLGKLGYLDIGHRALLAACFFVFNYVPNVGTWWVAHSWSLSVEEQFYIFWPALLVVVRRRNAAIAAVALIAVVPAIRIFEVVTLPANSWLVVNLWQMAHTRLDSLMFGCAIALLYDHPQFHRVLNTAFRFGLPWLALIYLFAGAPYLTSQHFKLYQAAIGYSLESLCISLLILWTVENATSLPGRVLNSRLLVHVGLISYSLYLWQQMFLVSRNTSWTGRFPLNLLCAFVMAEISFFAIEQPFLRMRQKLFFRKSHAATATTISVP